MCLHIFVNDWRSQLAGDIPPSPPRKMTPFGVIFLGKRAGSKPPVCYAISYVALAEKTQKRNVSHSRRNYTVPITLPL